MALTPRHLLVAFPVVIGLAKAVAGNAYDYALALSAGALSVLMFLIGGTFALTP